MTAWPFEPLVPFSYDLGVLDLPWLFKLRSAKGEAKSPQAHYRCLPDHVLAAMPFEQLFTAHSLQLWWCTSPMINRQLAVIAARGFRFITMGAWVKTSSSGAIAFGTGYRLRGSFEPFVVTSFGSPPLGARNVRSVFLALKRRHSEKPDEIYAIAERMHPRAMRRVDVFSRTDRPGWTAWGDEAGKFGSTA